MSRYEDIEQRLADWLEEGPIGAPDPPIAAALAHARTHPRRRWSAVGHWRTLMNGTNMTQVGPKAPQAGWLYAAAAVLVIVVVVAGGYGILQSVNPGGGAGGAAVPEPTATPTPASPSSVSATGSETCETLVGTSAATTTTIDGVKQVRGLTYDCEATNSDARLAGPGTATMNWDDYPDGTEVVWGTRVITNDGGTWRSVWNARTTSTATGVDLTAVFVGEGGYKGLVAPMQVHIRVAGGSTFAGTIMPAPPTVAGHETCTNDLSNRSEFTIDDIKAYRGVVATCTDTMSDPRVTGTGRNEISIDMRSDQSADIWGRYALSVDGGTWEGYWAGTVDEGYTTHHVESLLVGTGDFEGFLYRLSVVSDGTDTGFDLTGFIVPRP